MKKELGGPAVSDRPEIKRGQVWSRVDRNCTYEVEVLRVVGDRVQVQGIRRRWVSVDHFLRAYTFVTDPTARKPEDDPEDACSFVGNNWTGPGDWPGIEGPVWLCDTHGVPECAAEADAYDPEFSPEAHLAAELERVKRRAP